MPKRQEPKYREIEPADVRATIDVRIRTRENTYTEAQLARAGITEESLIERLSSSHKGWLCECDDRVAGFCIADRTNGELWVVAVLPEFERKGIGNELMSRAEKWLWACGWQRAWLTTDLDTSLRAYRFYRRRGWTDWKVSSSLRWMELAAPAAAGA